MAAETTNNLQGTQARFSQTKWTEILVAAKGRSPEAKAALEQLCKRYWYPLYAFIRRQGRSPEDAQDLTQGFLSYLLAKDGLADVHPAKGKFRSFLLACLINYVQNERDKEQAVKRGGGVVHLSFDALEAEEKYSLEPSSVDDPAKIFERRWAVMLLESVLSHLKQEYLKSGHGETFEVLLPFLVGDAERGDYTLAAGKLGTSEGNARIRVFRLREDYRALLYREVAETVDDPNEIEEEIRSLILTFQGS